MMGTIAVLLGLALVSLPVAQRARLAWRRDTRDATRAERLRKMKATKSTHTTSPDMMIPPFGTTPNPVHYSSPTKGPTRAHPRRPWYAKKRRLLRERSR